MSYQYFNPLKNGYQKIFITEKEHNKLFPNRTIRWFDHYDYYLNEKTITMECSYNNFFILFATMFLPIAILFNLQDSKNTIKDYKKLFKQKETGFFTFDTIFSTNSKYEEIKKMNRIEI